MHGGAKGSGGTCGNRNRFMHGYHSRAERDRARAINKLIQDVEALLDELS